MLLQLDNDFGRQRHARVAAAAWRRLRVLDLQLVGHGLQLGLLLAARVHLAGCEPLVVRGIVEDEEDLARRAHRREPIEQGGQVWEELVAVHGVVIVARRFALNRCMGAATPTLCGHASWSISRMPRRLVMVPHITSRSPLPLDRSVSPSFRSSGAARLFWAACLVLQKDSS